MRIREAEEKDVRQLASLAARTFSATYDDLSPEESEAYISEFFNPAKVRDLIKAEGPRILVAEEGSLIGYALLEPNISPISLPPGKQMECVRLFIDQAAQGKRLGSRLLKEALRLSRDSGFDTLWMKVWDKNHKAIRFYEKKGFWNMGKVAYTAGGMNDHVYIMARETDYMAKTINRDTRGD